MSSNGTSPEPGSPAEIEADIARQREELAGTVTALQHKLDVKSRGKEKAAELRERATTPSGKPRPELAGSVALVVALVVGLVILRSRRSG